MKYKDFEPSIIQEKRILKLCKRLNKFSLDEIETISEIDLSELKPIIDDLIQEERLTYCDGTYYYNKRVCKKQQTSKLQLFFEFHKKQDIEYIIKGFCADVEVLKMIDLFGFSNLLAANSILCCLRTASPQGIAALAAQGGVATLTERSDATFAVKQFSSADGE